MSFLSVLVSSGHGGCYPPLDASRQGSAAAFGNHCQGSVSPLESSANRVLSPLLETPSQRNCHPFGIPARFEMSTHKGKMVCGHSFQNINSTKYSECSAVTGIRKAELMHPAFLIPVFILMIAFALQLLQTAEHPPVHPNCTAAHRECCNPSLPGWTPTPDAPPASTRWSAGRSPSQRSG